jgi:hypothetical protein
VVVSARPAPWLAIGPPTLAESAPALAVRGHPECREAALEPGGVEQVVVCVAGQQFLDLAHPAGEEGGGGQGPWADDGVGGLAAEHLGGHADELPVVGRSSQQGRCQVCPKASGALPRAASARLASGVQMSVRRVSSRIGTRGLRPAWSRSMTSALVKLCVLPGP